MTCDGLNGAYPSGVAREIVTVTSTKSGGRVDPITEEILEVPTSHIPAHLIPPVHCRPDMAQDGPH